MPKAKPLVVGDVVVRTFRDAVCEVLTITRKGSRGALVTNDGAYWTREGKPWGAPDDITRIRLATEDDRRVIRVRKLRTALANHNLWRELPDDTIVAVANLLNLQSL